MRDSTPVISGWVRVGTSLTDVLTIDPCPGGTVGVQLTNSGQALNDLRVLVKWHPTGDWMPYLSGTDFSSASPVLNVSGTDPHTLASGSSAWFTVDVKSAAAVKIQESVASGMTQLMAVGNVRG